VTKAPADVFIQWKGTDVCLDFHCYRCNTFAHFDGDFAYVLKCPVCETHYEMPSVVPLKETARRTCVQVPTDPESELSESGWKAGKEKEVRFQK